MIALISFVAAINSNRANSSRLPAAQSPRRTIASVAPKPPMGWNSYDCYGYGVTEKEVLDNAKFMAKHLKVFGYKYVVVDFCWSTPLIGPNNDPPNQSANLSPRLAMDKYGRLLPDPGRFPSSKNGEGFKVLAAKIHAMGLKFGIHLMRGIPRQAVADDCPIWGTHYHAQDAFTQKNACPWLNQMWGLNMSHPAAQAYLNSIFKLYASWGVDFVKVDDMTNPYHKAEIEGYSKAIRASSRPIVYSLSPGETPLADAENVAKSANMWRLLGDLWDYWPQLNHAFDVIPKWIPYQKKGIWPDADMLPLGHLRLYGPNTGPANTMSQLTPDEQETLMTYWCLNRMPLMIGGDLPTSGKAVIDLLTNPYMIELDQSTRFPYRAEITGGPTYLVQGRKSGTMFFIFFNRTNKPVSTSIYEQGARWMNVWTGKIHTGIVPFVVSPHGCVVFRKESFARSQAAQVSIQENGIKIVSITAKNGA